MTLPVLIIGSGLGGLTLARSLQSYAIPCRIFERDAAEDQRAQGYRIGLDSVGVDALKMVLTPELFDRFEATCGEQHNPGGRIDALSGKVLQSGILGLIGAGGWGMIWELGSRYLGKRWERFTWAAVSQAIGLSSWPKGLDLNLPPGPDKRYQVDRQVLRSILLTSQAPHMTYESAFTHYTTTKDSVTAHFANGTSATGSLLVGADGVRSKVAAQLVGEVASPKELPYRIVYGKTPLTVDLDDSLHHTLKKGTSFVTDTTATGHAILMVMESMRFSHGPDLNTPDDYIFWALVVKDALFDTFDEALAKNPGGIAKHLTSGWRPEIKCIIDNQDLTQTASLRMRTSNQEGATPWPTNRRVTLLGDAIHCMPPTGGQGANLAMRDGATLGLALSFDKPGSEIGWSVDTIRQYEAMMRYNQGDIVGMACIGIRRIVP